MSFLFIEISILLKPRYPFLSLLRNGNQALCASNISNSPRHFAGSIEYLLLTVLVLKLVAYKVMFTLNWRPCPLFRKSFIFFSENGSTYRSVYTIKGIICHVNFRSWRPSMLSGNSSAVWIRAVVGLAAATALGLIVARTIRRLNIG
jgi:hypothetical protein